MGKGRGLRWDGRNLRLVESEMGGCVRWGLKGRSPRWGRGLRRGKI